jgi:hypothetical protein
MADHDKRPVLTIVGGQPDKLRAHDTDVVPGGIQAILSRASCDAAFRRRLLEDRDASLGQFELTLSERAALGAVPDSALEAMIEGYHE